MNNHVLKTHLIRYKKLNYYKVTSLIEVILIVLTNSSSVLFHTRYSNRLLVAYLIFRLLRIIYGSVINTPRNIGTMPVTTISDHCGFNNISNFNRRFLQFKDMTLSQFRKLYVAR